MNKRTNVRTYIRMGQTLYPLHNFIVRGDNNIRRRIALGKEFINNCKYTRHVILSLITIIMTTWILLSCFFQETSIQILARFHRLVVAIRYQLNHLHLIFSNLCNHLSFVHCNVQSLVPKLDILVPDLF